MAGCARRSVLHLPIEGGWNPPDTKNV